MTYRQAVFAMSAIILLALALVLARHFTGATVKVPPALTTRVDSMRITAPSYAASQESLTVAASAAVATAARHAARATVHRANADRSAQRADTLARDTLWRAAYEARTAEVVQLRDAFVAESLRADREVEARVLAERRADAAELRVAALTNLNNDVYRTLQRATECRVIGPIPCPSRTVVAVGGVIVGAGAVLWLKQARP
jgi:hypothetical protein